MMKAPSHYDDLVAACLSHMEHYKDDLLVHDLRCITDHPTRPFLHVTRDSGTHIQLLRPWDDPTWPAPGVHVPYLFATADRRHLLNQAEEFIDYFIKSHREENVLVHHFDGQTLRRTTYAAADAFLRKWAREIRDAWWTARRPATPPAEPLSLCYH